jgi:two-component system invasion response regulator UvrY
MNKLRIALADDHPPILDALKAMFHAHDWQVVGLTHDGDSALTLCKKELPDILILDVRFATGRDGLNITREMLGCCPSTKVIIYSQFEDAVLVREAYQAGCSCYVLKSLATDRLLEVVKRVANGETFFLPELLEPLAQLAILGKKAPADLLTPKDLLTDREFEVFLMTAGGKDQPTIASAMGLSVKTISNVSQSIKEKLNVTKASEMTRLAIKQGYDI